jgi:hypothetical protein
VSQAAGRFRHSLHGLIGNPLSARASGIAAQRFCLIIKKDGLQRDALGSGYLFKRLSGLGIKIGGVGDNYLPSAEGPAYPSVRFGKNALVSGGSEAVGFGQVSK